MSHRPPEGPVPHGPEGSFGPPRGWAPPPEWPPAAGTGWSQPDGPAQRRFHFEWSRVLPTTIVALVISAVVLGGIGLDAAIASPSAGTVVVNGAVSITAAPGWVLAPPSDKTYKGIDLRKANAILSAEVVASSYTGGSASLLQSQRPALDAESAQISYGNVHTTSINGYETSSVVYQALVASGRRSGMVDGELICMVVDGNALVVVVAAQQGHLDPVIDDITAMLKSVRPAR